MADCERIFDFRIWRYMFSIVTNGEAPDRKAVMATTADFWGDFTPAAKRKIWHGRSWDLPFQRSPRRLAFFVGKDIRDRI